MNNIKKYLFDFVLNVNTIALSLYLFFIYYSHCVLSSVDKVVSLGDAFFIFAISIVISSVLIFIIKKIKIEIVFDGKNKFHKRYYRVAYFLFPFLVLLIKYLCYYPGGFSSDSIGQYSQVIDNSYNDWHPVIQTLIAFKIPLLITNGWVGSIVLFQIISISLVIGYALIQIDKYINSKVAVFVMFLFILNPYTVNICMYPWKDVTFAIFALLLTAFLFKIVFSKGEWSSDIKNLILLSILVAITTLIRHNAMLFTAPYLITMFFYCNKKNYLILVGTSILCIFLVKVPLYSALKVKKPARRVVETIGLPLSIIGNVVSKSPDKLNRDILDFAYQLSPKTNWELKFRDGFNDVKWDKQTNLNVIDIHGPDKVIKILLECIKVDPYEALKGFFRTTYSVYSIFDNWYYDFKPYVTNNIYKISMERSDFLDGLHQEYFKFISTYLPHIFLYIGSMHLILIVVITAKYKLNVASNWKTILTASPIFVYNFGTMFLLSGHDDGFRFFYYTFLVTPIVLLILLKPNSVETKFMSGKEEK